MFDYYVQLRRDTGLPVLPIGLYLRVGMDGVGWDAYEEHFWEQRILRFEYAYVGLPALDAEQYIAGENLLGVALSTLMRVSPERRAELLVEGLKRIGRSSENDYRRHLLAECLEAYADLDETQKERLQGLLTTEQYAEVKPIMITTYERGKIAGRREGVQGFLEQKFGPLSEEVKQRLESLSAEGLDQIIRDYLKAQSLKDLGLED
jgi:hypothetical protein